MQPILQSKSCIESYFCEGAITVNNQRNILHIDDDHALTEIVAKRLEKHGYTVTSINNPYEGLTEIIRGQHRLVLLDIDMPNKNGIQLLKEIKQYDGGIQVVMLTGLVSVTTVLDSLRAGAEACLFKPVDDLQPLIDSLEDAFKKIDRWWASLNDLMKRRESDTTEPTFSSPKVSVFLSVFHSIFHSIFRRRRNQHR